MAVAALSTSSAPLTASPATTPAAAAGASGGTATGVTAPAFAQLVANAKSEDRTGPESRPEASSSEAEQDSIAIAGETAATTAPEAESKDAPADEPVDLLAEIEAMVAAAGQIGITASNAAQTAASPAKSSPEEGADTAATVTGRIAAAPPRVTIAATAPSFAPPAAVVPGAFRKATGSEQPAPAASATPQSVMAPAPEERPSANPDAAQTAQATDATPGSAARRNITALLASLKSAFTPGRAPAAADVAPVPVAQDMADGRSAILPPALSAGQPTPPIPATLAASPVSAPAGAIGLETAPETRQAKPVEMSPAAAAAGTVAAATAKPDASAATSDAGAAKPDAGVVKPDAGVVTSDADIPTHIASTMSADAPAQPLEAQQPAPDARDDAAGATPSATAPTAPTAVPLDTISTSVRPSQSDGIAAGAVNATGSLNQPDVAVERHLDLARDSQWLDRLARDISQAANQEGHLKFHLNPERLGALTVEIANSAAGTAIKLSTETDAARTIIADAQPRLIAEVRAQGLRVAETHVEINNQQAGGGSAFAQNPQGQTGQQRQSSADHQPFGRTPAMVREDSGDSASSEDGELYA